MLLPDCYFSIAGDVVSAAGRMRAFFSSPFRGGEELSFSRRAISLRSHRMTSSRMDGPETDVSVSAGSVALDQPGSQTTATPSGPRTPAALAWRRFRGDRTGMVAAAAVGLF